MDKPLEPSNEIEVDPSQSSHSNEKIVQETALEEPVQHIHAKTIILLIAVVGVYFVQVVHLTGIGVLTNTITAETGGADLGRWLAETVAITAGTLSPPVSQAADLWGRKWFLVGFTICGAVGCLILSRATSFNQLIVGQAIGALHAGAQCLIHAIASEIMPRKYRTIAQAATATAGGLGGGVGALLSGGLVRNDPSNWRIFFYIVTAMYVTVVTIVIWLYNPPPRELQTSLSQREKLARLDWVGIALFVPGLLLFCFALTSSTGVYPWRSAKIIGPIVVGIIFLVAFIIYEWLFTREGMLHHGVFTHGRNFPLVFGLFLIEGLLFFATNSYYSYEVAAVFGKPLFIAGAYYSLGFLILIVVAQSIGIYCSKTKTIRGPLVVAYIFFATYCAAMAAAKLSTPSENILGYVILFGVGIGISLNVLTATAQLSTPKDLIAITTGLVIGVRSVGGTIGLAIFNAIFNSTLGNNLPEKVGEAITPFHSFNPKNTAALLGGIESGNSTALEQIPGVTAGLIDAAGTAIRQSNLLAFRNVWIAAAALCGAAAIGSAFLINPTKEFNSLIDAPIETREELEKANVVDKLRSRV